jgi:hypothetical protein
MIGFLSGMTTMGYVIAGLFFFRFWLRTTDKLFAFFGVAFCLLAISQALSALADIPRDDQSWIYLLRFAAFMLLIAGIIGKNLGEPKRSS